MAEVFISFIHEEGQVAAAVQRFIQAHLKDHTGVFLSSDQWEIYAGESWLDRIISELRQAKVVVSLLSPESVVRPWVNFEAGAAWVREDTALIPVCFGGMTKGEMPKPYSSLQAVQLDDYFDQYYLLRSIFHYLKRPMLPSLAPLPPPFSDDEYGDANSPIEKNRKPYRELREALKRHNEKRNRRA